MMLTGADAEAFLRGFTPERALDLRLREGAGQPCLFLPFLGEFGHEIMSHVRIIHFSQAAEKIVCCRPGCEVLYPSAAGFVVDWVDPITDARRAGTMRSRPDQWPDLIRRFPGHQPIRAGQLGREVEILPIRPEERIPFRLRRRGLTADVVLGVRRRNFHPERNWPHWRYLADRLSAAGLTFAVIGDRATSYDLPGQTVHSGELDTDAAIELLQACRLYVGTDTGSSHLAATVGAPMLVFRETAGGSRDLTPRMAAVNPGRVQVVEVGWESPAAVAERAISLVRGSA